jgi:hypothetical protein
MNITCHHIESSEDEAAACDSTGWLYASHGWNHVDCPDCLAAQHRMHLTDLGQAVANPDNDDVAPSG